MLQKAIHLITEEPCLMLPAQPHQLAPLLRRQQGACGVVREVDNNRLQHERSPRSDAELSVMNHELFAVGQQKSWSESETGGLAMASSLLHL